MKPFISILHGHRLLMVVLLCLIVSSCSDDFESPSTPSGSTIYEIADGSSDFDLLVKSLDKTGLAATLNNTNAGQFTVFAPNDAAMLTFLQSSSAFNTALTEEEAIAKIDAMTNTTPSSSWNLLSFASRLNYHILSSVLTSDEVTGPTTQTTLSIPSSSSGNARLSLSPVGTDVLVNANTTANGAKVITADTDASNGVIHVIDRVLTAPTTASALSFLGVTINYGVNPPAVTVSSTASNYNVLANAIKRSDMATVLQPNVSPLPDFTIFAPDDAAFITYLGVADEATAISTINSSDKAELAALLQYHVVSGRVLSSDLSDEQEVSTLLTGKKVTIDITGSVITVKDLNPNFADPQVSTSNILTNAGVLHRMDSVLRSN